jgi:transposase
VLTPVQLTPSEIELLEDWRRYGTSPLIRDRALAVIINHQGKSAYFIAKILSRREATVRGWLKAFKNRRLGSLFTAYGDNTNASKLTPEQKRQISRVLSQPPSDYGIPKQFWQVKDLKRWIKAEFGVVYESDRSYHFLFQLSRFSWKLPDKFDIKRNDQLVEERIREIKEEIKPLLADSDWAVLAVDETRLVWESESRRAWLKTNQKTVIKVHRSSDYQSFLGGLDLKTGQCRLYSLAWQNQEEVIKALRKLKRRYPGKRICLVWDNAPSHKGKLIRDKLKKHLYLANFHLIAFPPYAPDTNPVEKIWKYSKDRIAHRETTSFNQKLNLFKLAVIHRKFNYQI